MKNAENQANTTAMVMFAKRQKRGVTNIRLYINRIDNLMAAKEE